MPQKADYHALFEVTLAVDLPSVAANTTVEHSVTGVPDLRLTDRVVAVLTASALTAGLQIVPGRVTADGTVLLRVGNHTAGALDAASQNMTLVIARR